MGCLFSKPKTDIWNDDVQGFDNFALDEKEVSGRRSQTFDINRATKRRRYSSERSGIWMNLDKNIFLGRDSKGTQTNLNTTSQLVQTDQVWRMYDDKITQTRDDRDDDNSDDLSIKQESDVCEHYTCETVGDSVDDSVLVDENQERCLTHTTEEVIDRDNQVSKTPHFHIQKITLLC